MEISSVFFELKPTIFDLSMYILIESDVLSTDAMQSLFNRLEALQVKLLSVKFKN